MTDAMRVAKCEVSIGYSKTNEWIHDRSSINIQVMRINGIDVPRFRSAGTVAGMDEDAASS